MLSSIFRLRPPKQPERYWKGHDDHIVFAAGNVFTPADYLDQVMAGLSGVTCGYPSAHLKVVSL